MSFFDAYRGERIGMQLADGGPVRNDPYTLPTTDDMPGFSSLSFLPYKLSLYAHAFRSAWYGAAYAGSTTGRFNTNRLKWRYRATTVDGLIGNSMRMIQEGITRFYRGNAFLFPNWNRIKNTARNIRGPKDLKNALGEIRRQKHAFVPRAYGGKIKPWKIIHSETAEAAFSQAAGSWSMGFLDKFYLSPLNIRKQLSSLVNKGAITGELFDTLTADNSFTSSLARELYGQALGRKARSQGKTDLISRAVWGSETTRRSRQFYRTYYKNRVQNRGTVSLWDIIKGEGEGSFLDRRKTFFTGHASVRFTRNMHGARVFSPFKATFRWNKAGYGKIHGRTAEAALRVLRDQGVDNIASAAVREASHSIASTVVSRIRMAKMLRGAGIIAYAVPAVLQAGMGMYKMVNEINSRMSSTMHRLTSTEFGSGQVLDNARIATERQRAIQAIQSAHMNARYLLGNEAALYH